MGISEKIEEIRKKPEHIRLRYVWGLVAVSMFFVIIIWIFSLKDSFRETKAQNNSFSGIKNGLEEESANQQLPSLEEVLKQSGKELEKLEEARQMTTPENQLETEPASQDETIKENDSIQAEGAVQGETIIKKSLPIEPVE